MKLVPFEMQCYKTHLSPRQVKSVLNRFSGFLPAFLSNEPPEHPPFMAEIVGDSFRIDSLADKVPPLRPEVWGEISQIEGETKVKVKVRMNRFLLVLLALWLAWIQASGFLLLYQNLPFGNGGAVLFGLNALFLLVYACLLFVFKKHSYQSKNLFYWLLQEEPKNMKMEVKEELSCEH